MNIRKSWLFSFLLVAFLATSAFSNNTADLGPETVNQQFAKLLKGIDVSTLDTDQTIYVDFMINEKSQIIVLSTNSKVLDRTLKARLNYKTLTTEELELFERYTVPISFKK
ncbi:MAG: hypothetical protein HKN09_08700 [Saprospiraceae bacterium]|nr:hypothetical protein [Saprospiraceae bacterium]